MSQYVDLRPDRIRPVQVHVDGTWFDGDLEAYRRTDGIWSGYVRYATVPNENRLGWFEEPHIRAAG